MNTLTELESGVPSDGPDADAERASQNTRSRTALVGFLGAFVRERGGWMPIAGVVALMGQFGLDASSVRTAVFRLKKRGWLIPERRHGAAGYTLSELALSALAVGDKIIWEQLAPAPLEDGWCIVNFTVPESARAKRHVLRSRLASLGFGNIGSGIWLAPARMFEPAKQLVEETGMVDRSVVFIGRHVFGVELGALVRSGWDLEQINLRYRHFLDTHRDDVAKLAAIHGGSGDRKAAAAFVAYLSVLEDWRRLPYHDPGLPTELLGEDWLAVEAGSLFRSIAAELAPPAAAYVSTYWSEER